MAALPEDDFHAAIGSAQLSRLTEQTIHHPEHFRQQIEQVRRQGYALNDSELQPGHRTLSVPVMNATGSVVASVGVNMLATPDTLEEATAAHLPLLHQAAEQIAEECAAETG